MAWAPDYCTVDDLAEFARISHDGSNTQLALAIAAASRAIDRTARRQFGAVALPAARYYTARWDASASRYRVEIDDLQDDTGLEVAGDTEGTGTYEAVASGFTLGPRNAPADGRPWTRLDFTGADVEVSTLLDGVEVTALWGWTEVPDAVREATLLQASRLLVRRDSPYGVAGSPEAGSEVRLLARLDPDVEVAIAPYRRRRSVVFA